GRGAAVLRLVVGRAGQGVLQVDRVEAVAGVAVGLEAPDLHQPQGGSVAVAVDEDDRRGGGLGRPPPGATGRAGTGPAATGGAGARMPSLGVPSSGGSSATAGAARGPIFAPTPPADNQATPSAGGPLRVVRSLPTGRTSMAHDLVIRGG